MMVLLGINSLLAALIGVKPYFHLQLVPHMTTYHQVCLLSKRSEFPACERVWHSLCAEVNQFWRILVHPFMFANSTELLMGELVLYQVGVQIER